MRVGAAGRALYNSYIRADGGVLSALPTGRQAGTLIWVISIDTQSNSILPVRKRQVGDRLIHYRGDGRLEHREPPARAQGTSGNHVDMPGDPGQSKEATP